MKATVKVSLPPVSMEGSTGAPRKPRFFSNQSMASVSTVDTVDVRRPSTDPSALDSIAASMVEERPSFASGVSSPRNSIGVEAPLRENSGVPRSRQKVVCGTNAQPALITSSVSLSDLHNAICDVTSCVEVAYFCSCGQAEHVPPSIWIVTPRCEDTCDFSEKLCHADVAILIVEDNEECVDRSLSMLSKVSASMVAAVSVLLKGHHRKDDQKCVLAKIARLMDSGAHDVAIIPEDSSQLQCMIAASLAKAEMSKLQRDYFESKLSASRTQCHRLFWQIAHEALEGLPQVRENMAEEYGKKVGNLEMLEKVGNGAFCDVYTCRSKSKGNICVAKIFKKDMIKSVDQLAQVVVEYETLRRLKHPNIVTGLNLVQGVRNIYLFMEMAGTHTLFQMIKSEGEHGLLWSNARDLLLQIVAGVAHMHDNDFAHCDLKPENIVLSSQGRAKLIDLGQAVHITDVPPLQHPKGTMPFMAPEIMQVSANWNPISADLWSLGVIMVEMTCGNQMFASILGWCDRNFDSVRELKKCADELLIVFAQSKENVLASLLEFCRVQPPSFVRSMLADLLEITPESRLHAKQMLTSLEGSL